MKIEVLPNVLSLEEIECLFREVDPKTTAKDTKYASDVKIKKVKCTEHHIVLSVLQKLGIDRSRLEYCSIVYYPEGASNKMHADNSKIYGDRIEQVKSWTHTGVIFLNDTFTGGLLHYPQQGCIFKPVIGTMVITPAGADYLHEVTKVESGERFTLVFRFI